MSAPTAISFDFDVLVQLIGGDQFGVFDRPCPRCGADRRAAVNRRRPVLRIWRNEPDFVTFRCARCGIEGHARRDARQAVSRSSVDRQEQQRRRAEADRRAAEDDAARTRRALAIWHEAEPIVGTIGSQYLVNRDVDLDALPGDMIDVLRWHRRCVWERDVAPCLVALWSDAITGEPRAIHRTALTPDARKIDRRSLGPTAGCCLRLWPDEDVERGLVLAEGVETTLVAATRVERENTTLTPAWACGDKGHLAGFPVLAGIESITILVDHDENGAGQLAAEECAQRWLAAGREVIRLTPRKPGDFNDLVRAGR